MILGEPGQEIKEKTAPGAGVVLGFMPGGLGSRRLNGLLPESAWGAVSSVFKSGFYTALTTGNN
jgi:hypothetical protein